MLSGFSAWIDSFGMSHDYWHGENQSETRNCECSYTDSCNKIKDKTLCNCDSMAMNQTDFGILKSKSLPVYTLQYGGAHTPYSSIRFKLGPLTCFGKRGNYPSEADQVELENIKSALLVVKNELKSTKQQQEKMKSNVQAVSDKLDDHLRTTTSTTTTTTTTTTTKPTISSIQINFFASRKFS